MALALLLSPLLIPTVFVFLSRAPYGAIALRMNKLTGKMLPAPPPTAVKKMAHTAREQLITPLFGWARVERLWNKVFKTPIPLYQMFHPCVRL